MEQITWIQDNQISSVEDTLYLSIISATMGFV